MCTQIHRQKSNLLIDLKTKRIRNSGACVHSFTANYEERTTYSTQIRSRKISVDLFFSSHFQCHRHVVRAAVVVLFYFSIPPLLEMYVCDFYLQNISHYKTQMDSKLFQSTAVTIIYFSYDINCQMTIMSIHAQSNI